MNQEDSNKKGTSAELVSKADLRESANHTNGRIDELKTHMVSMVDKMSVLIGAQIRAEERDSQNSKTIIRLENEIIILRKELKDYVRNNDARVAGVENQVMLLEIEDKAEKKAKEKAQTKKDRITTGIIVGLSIFAIVAIFQAIAPFIGK